MNIFSLVFAKVAVFPVSIFVLPVLKKLIRVARKNVTNVTNPAHMAWFIGVAEEVIM